MTPAAKRARKHINNSNDGAADKSSHGPVKGRAYIGRLAGLMHMPLDIFFEVRQNISCGFSLVTRVYPTDLVAFAPSGPPEPFQDFQATAFNHAFC